MKFACLDASLGISGDMFLAALLAAGAPRLALDKLCCDWLRAELVAGPHPDDAIGAWTVRLARDESAHRGHGLSLAELKKMIDTAPVPESVRARAAAMLDALAQAEARAHQVSVAQVHFHELGCRDTLLDLVGVPLLLHEAGLERVHCSPLELGRGTVTTSHGELPVPAPATRELLRGSGVPVTAGHYPGERTTPTGAVLAATLGDFSPAPAGTLQATGYGRGERNYEPVSRVTIQFFSAIAGTSARLWQLATNLDDCEPRVLAHTAELLLAAGARDVWTTPILMKKGRAGHTLQVLCDLALRAQLEKIIFRELPTFGVRAWPVERHEAAGDFITVTTSWGEVRVRVSCEEPRHATPEYEDCRALADRHQVPLHAVITAARAAVSPAP